MPRKHNRDHKDGEDSKVLKWTIILASAAIGLVIDYSAPGWGRPAVVTLLIFACLVVYGRCFWGARFWSLTTTLLVLHVVLVVRLRSPINEVAIPVLFVAAVAELFVIALVLTVAFPDR